MYPSYIAFLGLGFNQLEYLLAAKNQGYGIIGIDGDKNAICRALCDKHYIESISNYKEIISLLSKHGNIKGCISEQTDNGLISVGAVNSEFGLRGPGFDAVKSVKDKYRQRGLCRDLGVTQPEFILYEAPHPFTDEMLVFLDRFNDVVVKPVEGQSSIGVKRFSSQQLILDRDSIFKQLGIASGASRFLIEEFLPGEDISIEGLVANSRIYLLACCEKTKFEANPMVDRVLKVKPFGELRDSPEYELATRLIKGFGADNTLFHIEAKRVGAKLSLVEWTPRGCGARLSSVLMSKLYGTDLAAVRVGILRSGYQLPIFSSVYPSGLLQFFTGTEFEVAKVNALLGKHVDDYAINIPVTEARSGQTAAEGLSDGRSRPGTVIAVGELDSIQTLSHEMDVLIK